MLIIGVVTLGDTEDAHSLENENETDKYHGDDEIMRK